MPGRSLGRKAAGPARSPAGAPASSTRDSLDTRASATFEPEEALGRLSSQWETSTEPGLTALPRALLPESRHAPPGAARQRAGGVSRDSGGGRRGESAG